MELKVNTQNETLVSDHSMKAEDSSDVRRLEYASGLIIIVKTVGGNNVVSSNYNWNVEDDGSVTPNHDSPNVDFKDVN